MATRELVAATNMTLAASPVKTPAIRLTDNMGFTLIPASGTWTSRTVSVQMYVSNKDDPDTATAGDWAKLMQSNALTADSQIEVLNGEYKWAPADSSTRLQLRLPNLTGLGKYCYFAVWVDATTGTPNGSIEISQG